MDGATTPEAEVLAAAELYCRALHESDWKAFETLCHERFFMTSAKPGAGPEGDPIFIDKTAFVDRVRNRPAFAGEPSYEIFSIDVEGDEMASVKLRVDLPPRRFHDYLGFYRIGGEWRLVTKLYRTVSEAI